MTLSHRVKQACARIVELSEPYKEAAVAVGLKPDTLRIAFANPEVRRYLQTLEQQFRSMESARNLSVAVEIRDKPTLKDTASGNKVRIDAMRYIDGAQDGPSVQINIATQQQVPGYQIDLSNYDPNRLAHGMKRTVFDQRSPIDRANATDAQTDDAPTDQAIEGQNTRIAHDACAQDSAPQQQVIAHQPHAAAKPLNSNDDVGHDD